MADRENAKQNRASVRRLLPGLALAFAAGFLLFLYAPLELYLTNPLEFWFTAGQMLPYALALFACTALFLALLFVLADRLGEKLYTALAALGFLGVVCTWIQGSFLVGNLPAMNGTPVDWGAHPGARLASLLLWLIAAALIALALRLLGAARFRTLAALGSLAVCLLLGVTLIGLALTGERTEKSRSLACTDEGMFVYSEDENLLILVLDAVDSLAFGQVLDRDPAYPAVFEDFTYFPNTVGGYPYSKCSIPLIITGHWYEAGQSFTEFERAAFASSPVLQRVEDEGWRRFIYPYDGAVTASAKAGQFENLTPDQPSFSSFTDAAKILGKMAMVKHAPWDLKRFAYDLPYRLTELTRYKGAKGVNYYNWSDLIFYRAVKDRNPIETVPEKCWKYLHLEGAHQPHVYDKDMNVLDDSPFRDVIEGNITMLSAFLQRLKEAGVYDSTIIVLCSDHGSHNDKDLVTINQNPILLVKGLNEHHPFRTDDAPVSFDDLQTAYLRLLDGAQSDAVFDWHEGDARERRFFDYEMTNSDILTEYVQTGHAEDMETLLPTGRVYEYKK